MIDNGLPLRQRGLGIMDGIRKMRPCHPANPGCCIGFWIGERHPGFDRVMVNSLESLLDAHLISVWVAVVIEPGFIIKTACLHHSSVSFPMSHRIAIPRRFRISGQRSPVEVDHTVHVEVIEELDQPVFRLLSEKQTRREKI